MMHFTCDLCRREMLPGEDERYVVKIETFPMHDPCELTEADLEEDHMEAVSELLRELEDGDSALDLPEPAKHLRYDLCPECHQRFLRDPLGKEHKQKMYFSKN